MLPPNTSPESANETPGTAALPVPANTTSAMVERLTRSLEQLTLTPPPVSRPARPQQPPSSAPEPSEGFGQYWHVLRRHKVALTLATAVGALCGVIYTLPQTPIYRSITTLEVLDSGDGAVSLKDLGGSTGITTETNLMTQVSILQSDSLQKRVVRTIRNKNIRLPQPNDRYDGWRRLFNLPSAQKQSLDDMINATLSGIAVKASPADRIIEISVDSPNPGLAATYANTLAAEFIDERLESHWQATQHASEWLTRQLSELKVKLEKSEDELQRYGQASNLQFTGAKDTDSAAEEKLRQLQAEVSTAQADRVAKQARYEIASKAPADSLAEVLDDDALRTIRTKLTDLRRELADLSSSLTGEYPRVKRVQAQIAALETDLARTRSRILDRIHNDLLAAETREQLLNKELSLQSSIVEDQAGKSIHYNILKREVDSNRQLYDSLLQKVKESGVASAMHSSNFRVIDEAVAAGAPIRPSLRRGMIFGIFFGLIGGIGFILIRDSLDRSITVPGETHHHLGAPELGVIPSLSFDRKSLALSRATLKGALADPASSMLERIAFTSPGSMTAEAFRVALTSMLLANDDSSAPRVIAVSSSGPHEGKTTVVCNLAIAFAEISWKVLLIDGDMRRPRLHSIFGLQNDRGLANMLQGDEPLSEIASAIQPTEVPNLHVITRGRLKGPPANLLYSPKLREVLANARQMFDVVLIDTPPMLHLPDARTIGHLADGLVLVVRAGRTTREVIATLRERAAQDDIRMLGSILNDWHPRYSRYDGYENYSDYRSYYLTEGPGSDKEIS